MANHLIKKRRPLIIQPTTPARKPAWPKWFYEVKTGRGAIFRSQDEVPSEGWVDSYAKTDKGKAEAKALASQAGTAGSTHSSLYYTSQESTDADDADDEELDEDDDTGNGDEPDELEDVDDIDVETIKQRLRARSIPFAARANKATLYQLLEENWIQE